MKLDPVTTRYSSALFELARERGVLDLVQTDVDSIARENASGALAPLFDARVAHGEKDKRVEALAARLQPLAANFVRVLFHKRRLDVLRNLPAAFRRASLAHRGIAEGVVESAHALGAGELAELSVAVKAVLGKDVLLEQRPNPELIAGVRVFVDNRLIDQSALGRLEGLERQLRLARVH